MGIETVQGSLAVVDRNAKSAHINGEETAVAKRGAGGGIPIPASILEQLDDNGKKGWSTRGYRKTLDDQHLHLLCKYLYEKYGAEGGKEWSLPPPSADNMGDNGSISHEGNAGNRKHLGNGEMDLNVGFRGEGDVQYFGDVWPRVP